MGVKVVNKKFSRSTGSALSRQWEAACDEASDLDKYNPDWDGAGADAVPLIVIRRTLDLFRRFELLAFPAPDSVYPAADGTVFVEWHHPNGVSQLLNIRLNGISVVMMGPDGKIIPPPPTDGSLDLSSCDVALQSDGDAFEFVLAA